MRTCFVLVAVGLAALIAGPALAADLLVNGDFDTGSLGPWVVYGEAWPAVPPPSIMTAGTVWVPTPNAPTSDGYLAGIGYGGNVGGGNAALYQTVSGLTPGATYTLEGDWAGGVGGMQNFNGVAWWEIRVNDGGWQNPDAGTLLAKKELNTETGFGWEHVNLNFAPGASTVTVFLKYGAWDPQWDYMYVGTYFDSFHLVPEPAVLALLGLGMPLLRRRFRS